MRRSLATLAVALLVGATACGGSSGASGSSTACPLNQCQKSGTLTSDGQCEYVNKPDGTGCDDGESCTIYDRCKAGVCVAGTTLADGTACDDKNVCTQTDACSGGKCVGTNPLVCPAGDACHQGNLCDPQSGCTLKSYGPCVQGLASTPLSGCVSSAYTAKVQVGTGTFDMLLDSGSTTIAVAAANCNGCGVTPTYTPSSSAYAQNQNIQAVYGDSTSWIGAVYTDNLVAGAAGASISPTLSMRFASIYQDPNASVPGLKFFTGSNCSGTTNTSAFQGIWGLGPRDLALNYTDTFLDKLAATAVPRYDAFAVGLCNMGGNLFLGGFNPAAVTQAPNFTPWLASSDYYAVTIDDALVGNTSIGLSSYAWGSAIIDTGTEYWILPAAVYQALTSTIAANTNFQANFTSSIFTSVSSCQTSAQGLTPAQIDALLPPVSLLMPSGGKVAGMSVTQPATASYLQAINVNGTTKYCSTLVSDQETILGAAALRRQLVVIDRTNAQVGFAPLVGCSNTLPVNAAPP